MSKTTFLRLRASLAEKETFEAAAEASGLSFSAWARQRLLYAARTPSVPPTTLHGTVVKNTADNKFYYFSAEAAWIGPFDRLSDAQEAAQTSL